MRMRYPAVVAVIRQVCCTALFILPLLWLLLSAAILFFIATHSYSFLLDWYGVRWPGGYAVSRVASDSFTFEWYQKVRAGRLVFGVAIVLAMGGYLWQAGRVWSGLMLLMDELGRIVQKMGRVYREMTGKYELLFWGLFGVIVAYRIYFYLAIPLTPDEICSYLFFSHQGWLMTTTSFIVPNNHMLYNLVTGALGVITGWGPRADIRLPNMLANVVLLYGIFCWFWRREDPKRAFLVVAGIAFGHTLSYYAVLGRGYQLQEIAVLVSGWGCYEGFRAGGFNRKGGLVLFIVFAIVGMYLVLTFFYFLLASVLMAAFFIWKRKDYGQWGVLLKSVGVIVLGTVILYLPAILASGWQSFSNNPNADMLDYAGMVHRIGLLAWTFRDSFYYGWAGTTAGMVIVVLFMVWLRRGIWKGAFYADAEVYGYAMVVSYVVLVLLAKAYPPSRTLMTWVIGVNVFFVSACYDWLSERRPGRVMRWMVLLLVVKIAGSVRGLYIRADSVETQPDVLMYKTVEGDIEALDKLRPAVWQVSDFDDLYPMYLRLYLLERGDQRRVVYEREKAVGDVLFLSGPWKDHFSKDGYELWGERGLLTPSNLKYIFVGKGLYLK